MADIPLDIQMEIIKKVSNVKSLIKSRSVSKTWKSFIDNSEFIKRYGARHTQPHSLILSSKDKFIYLVEDDNNESLKVQQQEFAPFVRSPLLKQYFSKVVGVSHGLVCLYGIHSSYKEWMLVIWNSSIGKSFGIAAPQTHNRTEYAFGVCPVTKDPTIVKIIDRYGMPWLAEVFALSSRAWNVIPCGNMFCESVRYDLKTQVVIDRFIYWGAREIITSAYAKHIVVSFDLITKEFKVVDLPNSLRNELNGPRVFVSKLREALVVYGSIYVNQAESCGVWVMEHDSSFRKLFTIGAPVCHILGFRKSGEPIFETSKKFGVSTVDVYDPWSQRIKNLGICGTNGSFFMDSYKESLLLLNYSDSRILLQ